MAGRSSSFGKGVVAFRPLEVDGMVGGERGRRMIDGGGGGGDTFRDLAGGVFEFLLFTLMDVV
jgi:hypothetical protein